MVTFLKPVETLEAYIGPDFLEDLAARRMLSELEFIVRALKFANRGTFASLADLEGLGLESTAAEGASEGLRERQAALRAALAAILRKRAGERVALWRHLAAGVLIAGFGWSPPAEFRYRVVRSFQTDEPTGLAALALAWLTDKARPFGRDLCQCKQCGDFFLVKHRKKQGKPLRAYCCREHMKEAHEAAAARRMREWRERRKQRAKKPRRTPS